MVIQNVHFLQKEHDMTEPEQIVHEPVSTEAFETPEVTENHPDNEDAGVETTSDDETSVDTLVQNVDTEPLEDADESL